MFLQWTTILKILQLMNAWSALSILVYASLCNASLLQRVVCDSLNTVNTKTLNGIHQMFVNVFGLELCWLHACSALMCPTGPRISSSVSLLLDMRGLCLCQRSGHLSDCFEVKGNVRAKSKIAGANPVISPDKHKLLEHNHLFSKLWTFFSPFWGAVWMLGWDPCNV